MKLLILKTQQWADEVYDIFLDAIEKLDFNLVAFVTLIETEKFDTFKGYANFPRTHIDKIDYDFLLIDCYVDLAKELFPFLQSLNVPLHKVRTVFWLLQQMMIKKYEYCGDKEIQETLKFWETHELSVFNQHLENCEHTFDEVHTDESNGLPYIIFKTIEDKERKMYFPRNCDSLFQDSTGKFYVKDVLREQNPNSPHLYTKNNHTVEEGDILIDAGVCEGNFSLRYADICSKIYLFESDSKWFEPLYHTFKDYGEKVQFFFKRVDSKNRGGAVTLDSAVTENDKKIFLKMDIEGAETSALRGAKNILTHNKIKASVCSYHNFDDEIKIKSIFQNCGYKTEVSAGYMIFLEGFEIWNTMDFRRGVIYAENH